MNDRELIRYWASLIDESEDMNEGLPDNRQNNGTFMNSLWKQSFQDKYCIVTKGNPRRTEPIEVLAYLDDGYRSLRLPVEDINNYGCEEWLQSIKLFDSREDAYRFIMDKFLVLDDPYKTVKVDKDGRRSEISRFEFPLKDAITKVDLLVCIQD